MIITDRCLICHDPAIGQDQLPALNTYQGISSSASQSLDQLALCRMPPPDAGFDLSAQERQDLLTWYVCGAPNN